MAHFGPIAALFLIPLGGWGKGGGVVGVCCFKSVDQTRTPLFCGPVRAMMDQRYQ